MSIVALKKLTLYGETERKQKILADLQELGCLHLVDLSPATTPADEIAPKLPEKTCEAVRHLRGSPLKRRPVTREEGFDLTQVVEQALANRKRKREVQDRIDDIRAQIRDREPWGEFELPAPDELGGIRLWFYVVPRNKMRQLAQSDLIWKVVRRDNRNAYVVVLAEERPAEEAVPAPLNWMGPSSLSELYGELERADGELEEVMAERWSLSRWRRVMQRHITRAEDIAQLQGAADLTLDDGPLFAVQGWVPTEESARVRDYALSSGLAVTIEEPGADDTPPVAMQNPRRLAFGEELLAFYQLPGYRDWDPSSAVLLSFAVFFGMIMADAGYAALLGVALLLLWKRMGSTGAGRGMRDMLTAIVLASLAIGVMLGSYFGVSPRPESLPGRLKIVDVNDFNSMMQLSIVIGGLHVILANLRTVWHRRRRMTALAPLGWASIVAGGLIAFVGLGTPAVSVGLALLGAGAVLVFLFTGTRPVRGPRDLLARVLDGLKGLAGFSGLFGDVLSYLRLFALALASASLAMTFNELARGVAESGNRHGIFLFLGLLVLIVGHGLNLTLAIISGVVHGLRLNLIEFYKYSVFEEGMPFRAFRKKENVTWKA
jgi:V/A-type H+-transporting ATPase subunit I